MSERIDDKVKTYYWACVSIGIAQHFFIIPAFGTDELINGLDPIGIKELGIYLNIFPKRQEY